MRKSIIIIAFMVCLSSVLTGCEKVEDYSEYPFTGISWTRTTESDSEYISFSEDGNFSYYCGCGNSVNDSDLCSGYSYNPDTNEIVLEYEEKLPEVVTEIVVKSCKNDELVLDFDGDIRVFVDEDKIDDLKDPDTISYKGNTYNYLEYNADIFGYNFNGNDYYEEDVIYPIPHEKWDIVYCSGDLFVLDTMVEEAYAYYGDDNNYEWFVMVEDVNLEDATTISISISPEELSYIYAMDDMEKDKTFFFDDIQKFGTLIKTSKDGLVSATIGLMYHDGDWYWRSEIIDESQEGWPEYIFRLPQSLIEKINLVD